MFRVKRGVLGSTMVASLLFVSAAGAARVRVTGGTRITATGATASRLVNHTGSQTLMCNAETAEGALRPHTTGSFPVVIGHRMHLGFTSCTLITVTLTVNCAHAQLRFTGVTVGGVTPGSILNIQCDIRLGTGTTSTCHVSTANAISGGSTAAGSYSNAGTFTVDQDHTNIGLTGSPAGCVLKNSTSARFQNSTGGNLVYNVSPAISINAA
jgi:hypothetical protein